MPAQGGFAVISGLLVCDRDISPFTEAQKLLSGSAKGKAYKPEVTVPTDAAKLLPAERYVSFWTL